MPFLKQDSYEITPSGCCVVHSKSGYTYVIDEHGHCSCPGYGFRGTCRHVQNAPRLQPQAEISDPKAVNVLAAAIKTNEWIETMIKRLTHGTS